MRELIDCEGRTHKTLVRWVGVLGNRLVAWGQALQDCGCTRRCKKLNEWWTMLVAPRQVAAEIERLRKLVIAERSNVYQRASERGETPPNVNLDDLCEGGPC